MAMRPIETLTADQASGIEFVLTDIDDTLTENGYLGAEAYGALWRLHDHGIRVVPITGRPAGWCDLIIREWPVQAVVGENGAFVYYRDGERIGATVHPSVASGEIKARLSEVKDAVLREVPGSRVARDQFARLYDLAIDFREDPPRLSIEDARRIKAVCERFGARAKISSIHVNAWFGDYDKLSMTKLFLAEQWGVDEGRMARGAMFCGDSPNDEPMFRYFPLSCAVANVDEYANLMEALPTFRASRGHGAGFAEIADTVLRLRRAVR